MQSVHGHEVMRMMLERPEGFTRAELVHAILERFGTEARFHTCSAEMLTAEGLVTFLQERGKFVEQKGRMQVEPDRICQHE
jgi:probable metal-binding protein